MNEQTISIFFFLPCSFTPPPPPPPSPFVYKIRRKTQVGYIEKNWVGAGGTLPEFLTLFQPKNMCFSLLYFTPDQKFDTLFQT